MSSSLGWSDVSSWLNFNYDSSQEYNSDAIFLYFFMGYVSVSLDTGYVYYGYLINVVPANFSSLKLFFSPLVNNKYLGRKVFHTV